MTAELPSRNTRLLLCALNARWGISSISSLFFFPPPVLFSPPCQNPAGGLNASSVFRNVSATTVLRCEGRQKCSLHLRTSIDLQLAGSFPLKLLWFFAFSPRCMIKVLNVTAANWCDGTAEFPVVVHKELHLIGRGSKRTVRCAWGTETTFEEFLAVQRGNPSRSGEIPLKLWRFFLFAWSWIISSDCLKTAYYLMVSLATIYGVSICAATTGMMTICRTLSFTKASQERMSGMQVHGDLCHVTYTWHAKLDAQLYILQFHENTITISCLWSVSLILLLIGVFA